MDCDSSLTLDLLCDPHTQMSLIIVCPCKNSTVAESMRNNSTIAGHALGKKSKSCKQSNRRQKLRSKSKNADRCDEDTKALDKADGVQLLLILVTGKNEFRNSHDRDKSRINTNKKSVSKGLKDLNIDKAETHNEPSCMETERNERQKASRMFYLDKTEIEQKSQNSYRNSSGTRNENSTKDDIKDMKDSSSSKPACETAYISSSKEIKNWFQITPEAEKEDGKFYDICEATSSTTGCLEVLNNKNNALYLSRNYEKFLTSIASTKMSLSVTLWMSRHNSQKLQRISETVLANVNTDMKKEIRTVKKDLGCEEGYFYPSPRMFQHPRLKITGKKDGYSENEIEIPKGSNFDIKALETRDNLEKQSTRLLGHPKLKITENEGDSSKNEIETQNMRNGNVEALEESQGHGHYGGHQLLEDVTELKDEMLTCYEKTEMFQSSLIRCYLPEEFKVSAPMVNALEIIPVDKKLEWGEMRSQKDSLLRFCNLPRTPFNNLKNQTFMESNDQWQTEPMILQQEDKEAFAFRDFISPQKPHSFHSYSVYMLRSYSYSQKHPQSINGIPWEDFERETMRIASFSMYPRNARKSAALLANSGFVYWGDGNSDKVICFFCCAVKENWQIDDDIDEVHKQLNPQCPMVVVLQSNITISNSTHSQGSVIGAAAGPLRANSNSERSGTSVPGHSSGNNMYPPLATHGDYQSNSLMNPSSALSSSLPVANRTSSSGNVSRRVPHHSINPEATGSLAPDPNANSTHPIINSQIYSIPRNPANPSAAATAASASSGHQPSSNAPRSQQLNLQDLGIFHERPRNPELAILAKRVESFEGWDPAYPKQPEELARAGFVHAGYLDSTKCFFCGLQLRRWESQDDPFVEHARWGSKCGYLRQCKGPVFVGIVERIHNERRQVITIEEVMRKMQELGVDEKNQFEDTPVEMDPAVKSLLDAGYKKEDVFQIARELRDAGATLSADTILKELQKKNPTSGAASTGSDVIDGNVNEQETIEVLKDENYVLRNNLICKVCMVKEVRMVFLPCGHLVACQECAVALLDCPVCRRHIRASVRATIR